MPRISATINVETSIKIHENAINKKKSHAQYIRELIDVGLRIEELSIQRTTNGETKSSDLDNDNVDSLIKTLLKINLRCGVESLTLTRCLVDGLLSEKSMEYLSAAKQKSEVYVDGLFKECI